MTIYSEDPRLYDMIYGGDDARVLNFVRWLLEFLDIGMEDSLLDMGAGTASILIPITKDGYSIEGMEPYAPMLEYGLVKADLANVDITLKSGSFQTLTEEDRYRLIMAMNGPLHYVNAEELPLIFENLARALQPGGYLVLDTINFLSIVKTYEYPDILDFEVDGAPATAMIQHWVDLDKEKWYNRVVLFYKDQEHQKFDDIQEMSVYTRTHLQAVAKRFGLEFAHFFSSYEDEAEDRTYGGRLITVFKKE